MERTLTALILSCLLAFSALGQVKISPNGGGVKIGQTVKIQATTAAGTPTPDAAVSVLSTGNGDITLSITIASGATLLLVGCATGPATPCTGVTHNGSAMTAVPGGFISNTDSGADITMATFYIVNPTSGTHDIVASFSGAPAGRFLGGISILSSNTSTPLGTAATAATNNSTTPSVTVTSATGELVVDFEATHSGATSFTAGAGQTRQTFQVGAGVPNGAISTEAGAASVVMDWTLGASRWSAQVGIPVKP